MSAIVALGAVIAVAVVLAPTFARAHGERLPTRGSQRVPVGRSHDLRQMLARLNRLAAPMFSGQLSMIVAPAVGSHPRTIVAPPARNRGVGRCYASAASCSLIPCRYFAPGAAAAGLVLADNRARAVTGYARGPFAGRCGRAGSRVTGLLRIVSH